MILYHISKDLLHDGTFYPTLSPSIPQSDIPGVALSFSIEGCLSSMLLNGVDIHKILEAQNNILRVFELHLPENHPLPNVLYSMDLVKKGLVPDALETEEHWITCPFEATTSYLIQIIGCKVGSVTQSELELGKKIGSAASNVPMIKKVFFTSSRADVAKIKIEHPGKKEWATFLKIGRQITGKRLRVRKDNIYRSEKCKEEFFYLAANFGTNIKNVFQCELGQSTIPTNSGDEEYKLWDGMIIYRSK